jgi:hypothetical protein
MNLKIIKQHWDGIEPGYFDRNKKFIDKNGWLKQNMFSFKRLTKRGKKLLEQQGDFLFRPKTMNGL